MHRLIVVGSPRAQGRSASLANELFNACIEECPDDGVSIVSVASTTVAPCTGCDECRASCSDDALPAPLEEGDPLYPLSLLRESDAARHRCLLADDMDEVRKHLDAADQLVVVAPVYFAGCPAPLSALLDRLQPYYWSDVRQRARVAGRRPCVLHVVGEGGDPHGFEPLIGKVRSAVAVAGFELDLVLDWTGCIDGTGEITADAAEYPLPPVGGFAALLADGGGIECVEIPGGEGFGAFSTEDAPALGADVDDEWDVGGELTHESSAPKPGVGRPRLNLTEGGRDSKRSGEGGKAGKGSQGSQGGKGGKSGKQKPKSTRSGGQKKGQAGKQGGKGTSRKSQGGQKTRASQGGKRNPSGKAGKHRG